jgi:phosphatidylglycerophosphate synthase
MPGRTAQRGARALGLSRPGDPPETRAGAPLRPLTVPNVVGYLRIAALAVFFVLMMSSGDGHDTVAFAFYAAASGGDYLDGILARATGQYSRLGALMDPLIDRLVVISGVVVCWKFELLPRWALAVLLIREAVMVIAVSGGLRLGLDISINWAGRLAVWPTMAAIALAMLSDSGLADWLLYVGIAGSLIATAGYIRDGVVGYRRLHSRPAG